MGRDKALQEPRPVWEPLLVWEPRPVWEPLLGWEPTDQPADSLKSVNAGVWFVSPGPDH